MLRGGVDGAVQSVREHAREGGGHRGRDQRRVGGAREFQLDEAAGVQMAVQHPAERAAAARGERRAVEGGVRGEPVEEGLERGAWTGSGSPRQACSASTVSRTFSASRTTSAQASTAGAYGSA